MAEETQALANPGEQMETRIQMQELRELTVGPNRMKLPCKKITTAENSPQMVVELDHPVDGTLRFYLEKPIHGWNDDQEWVKFLNWYNIRAAGIYELQGGEEYKELQAGYNIHVRWIPQDDEWRLVKPPDNRPLRQKLKSWDGVKNIVSSTVRRVKEATPISTTMWKTDVVAGVTIIGLVMAATGAIGTLIGGVGWGSIALALGIPVGLLIAVATVPASREA